MSEADVFRKSGDFEINTIHFFRLKIKVLIKNKNKK